ncbi:hypothetical protein JW859_11830 [bacterium]|nr:hypothetical protein [bacterium]
MAKTTTTERPSKSIKKTVLLPDGTSKTEVIAATPVKPVGICSTCRHQPRCLFFKAARQAIHTCEEFAVAGADDEPAAAANGELTFTGGVQYGEGQSAGLCVNCETRLTCMHRRPGEQVTECEDYS